MRRQRISTLAAAAGCPRPLADIEPAALGRLSRAALEAIAGAACDLVLLPDSLGDGLRTVTTASLERLQATLAVAFPEQPDYAATLAAGGACGAFPRGRRGRCENAADVEETALDGG